MLLWDDLDQDRGSKIAPIMMQQIKGTAASTLYKDSVVPLMLHDLSDLG